MSCHQCVQRYPADLADDSDVSLSICSLVYSEYLPQVPPAIQALRSLTAETVIPSRYWSQYILHAYFIGTEQRERALKCLKLLLCLLVVV